MRTKLLILFICAAPVAAHAYIDPGTGSALIQGVIAGIAAIGVTVKLYWHRLVSLFRRKGESSINETNAANDSNEPQ